MPVFTYIARNRKGQQVSDSIDSPNRDAAIVNLRQEGLLVLKIDEVQNQHRKRHRQTFSLNPLDYRAIQEKELEHEFHQIAVMLRSGISLLDALNMTAEFARIGAQKTWDDMIERIEQGGAFSDAMQEHKVFNFFTIQLVKVGEQTGHLYLVLDQAANEIKSSRRLKKQIVSALKYPVVTLLFAIGLVVFMLTSIVPEIKELLKIMGKPMPPITQALIDVSDWFVANSIFLSVSGITFITVFIVFYNWSPSRWWIDRSALKLPILGKILRLSGTVLFSRAMGLLLRSGVLISEALVTMEKLHANKYIASRVAYAHRRILLGNSLSDSLKNRSGFMPLFVQMVGVGESSGTMDEIMQEMADYHDELLQQSIAQLTGMIAPTMTVVVGGVVGFVYAAFLVAMFSAAGGSPS